MVIEGRRGLHNFAGFSYHEIEDMKKKKLIGEREFYEGFNNQPCEICGRIIAEVGNGRVYNYRTNDKNWRTSKKACQECRDEKYGGEK